MFEVQTSSGMLRNTDSGNPMVPIGTFSHSALPAGTQPLLGLFCSIPVTTVTYKHNDNFHNYDTHHCRRTAVIADNKHVAYI